MKWFNRKKSVVNTIKQYVLKQNCSEITILDFIRCQFHKDFSVLFAEKSMFEPKNEAQQQAINTIWNGIFEEWAGLTDNSAYGELLRLMNEVIRLNDIILRTDVALTVLHYRYSPDCIKVLQELSYPVTFPKDDKVKYMKDIETVIGRSKGVKIQLDIAVKAIAELQKNKSSEQTENDFMDGVTMVGKFLGTPINIRLTSLYEYASFIRMNNKAALKQRTDNDK